MKNKALIIFILLAIIITLGIYLGVNSSISNGNIVNISKLNNMIEGTWQAEVKFPDWKGYIDDTLAMNSMYSFDGFKDQGKIYFTIGENVESFDLSINNKIINTSNMKNGIYEIDISKIAKNNTNTIQVCNIVPNNLEEAITVNIPYPTVIDGTLKETRIK